MSLRFHEIAEANHRIMNPLSEAKLLQIGQIARLKPGMRLLDLACGQGEMLARFAQNHGITGTGVDISPFFAGNARQRAQELGVADCIEIHEGDAAQFVQETHDYDVVSCIGATWIGNGTVGTLNIMKQALKPGPDSLLLVGEVFWNEVPPDDISVQLGFQPGELTTLGGLPARFAEAGTELVEMVVSNKDDWDRYEAGHWITGSDWLRANPDDPDAAAFREWLDNARTEYLALGRDYFGWGVFVLRPLA